jgi:ribosomal protein S18 acetylase RimI-like enzyme
MLIRDYRPEDRNTCLEIFDSNQPQYFAAWERQEFAEFLDREMSPYLVLEDNGKVIACGGYALGKSAGEGVLCWGMVRGDGHRNGLGRMLLEARLKRLFADPAIQVVVINTSQLSAGFYEKFGFEVSSKIPDGFAPGIDKWEMRLTRGRFASL